MAKKKSGVNKSQAIRDHLAEHPEDGPKAIVVALRKQKIKVSEALASNVKYTSAGKKKQKNGRRKKAVAARPASDKIALSTLVQAKKMADQLGGIEKAKTALAALSKLQ